MSTIPSRRAVLAALTASAATAIVPAVARANAASSDAELIRLCAGFDALDRGIRHLGDTIRDDDERTEALWPLWDKQDELMERLTELRATTLAGLKARAGTLALHDPGAVERLHEEGNTDQRMIAMLARDVLAMGGAI